jgi:fructokinase
VILVAGESLIDLIVEPEGSVRASPGGRPVQCRPTIARLGHPTRFLGRFPTDPFGRRLTGRLSGDGVHIALPDPVEAPASFS